MKTPYTLRRGVDPEIMKKLGVVAKDMHEILIAHRMDESMSVNAFCLALATQIKWCEVARIAARADRAKVIEGLITVLTKYLELMDEA